MLTPEPAPAPRKPKAAPQAAAPGAPQVISYRHPDRRKNNPEVGLVNEASDPEQPKTTYTYDSMGRLTRTDFPDGTNEQSTYDAEGRRLTSIDRAGRARFHERTFDARGAPASDVVETFEVA
jgi:YD repeat-containing protein